MVISLELELDMELDPGAAADELSSGEEGMGLVFGVWVETVRAAVSVGIAAVAEVAEGDADMEVDGVAVPDANADVVLADRVPVSLSSARSSARCLSSSCWIRVAAWMMASRSCSRIRTNSEVTRGSDPFSPGITDTVRA